MRSIQQQHADTVEFAMMNFTEPMPQEMVRRNRASQITIKLAQQFSDDAGIEAAISEHYNLVFNDFLMLMGHLPRVTNSYMELGRDIINYMNSHGAHEWAVDRLLNLPEQEWVTGEADYVSFFQYGDIILEWFGLDAQGLPR